MSPWHVRRIHFWNHSLVRSAFEPKPSLCLDKSTHCVTSSLFGESGNASGAIVRP